MFAQALREIITAPLGNTFLAFTHEYPYPYTGWHYHPEYEVHLIRKTSGSFYVGTHAGQFDKGHVVMTGPNLPHMWVTTAIEPGDEAGDGLVHGRDVVVQFSAEFAAICMRSFRDCAPLERLLDESRAGLEFSPKASEEVEKIMVALLEADSLDRLALFFRLLACLSGDVERVPLSVAPPSGQDDSADRLTAILEYIAEHCTSSDLTCEKIARVHGMSPPNLSHLFEKQTRCTCVEYINRLRVYKACQQLAETNDSITTICYEVGYNVLSTFNRNFVRFIGITPSQFRLQRDLKLPRDDDRARLRSRARAA
ncbi:AraC family transcriptional regulator [Consotaella salsifontis]|uniref:Helix-turn-helix domain-containing protein n=1 Tax=Consotaella salsifontis TaxID=1365950 RepID=A0A1T4QY13_9HYPH|nr:AraC family transcriptional regulator [Consotaella salsifontis]SKA08437.1 Helix-turn-helix domain-containing protein [Consotaella salsifontis]